MRYCVRIALNTAEITPLDETRNFSTANLDCFYVIKRSVDRSLFHDESDCYRKYFK